MKKFIGQSMLASLLVLTAVTVQAAPFTVDALLNSSSGSGVGLNTGINLSAGEVFTVSVGVNDLWSAGALPRWSNADGLVGNLFATAGDESGAAPGTLIGQNFGLHSQNGLSAPFGTLVGELSGTFFTLGTSFSGPAPVAGTLHLFYWDSNNADNTGSVVAEVNRSAVPEPGTGILLTLGLVGLFNSLRRSRSA